MIHRIPLLLLLLAFGLTASAQKKNEQFKIAFYNTENLFDTIDDPAKSDNDFVPSSKVGWTSERYYHKIHNIGKVLVAIDSVNLPAVIGMAEVENIGVLHDLITQTRLRDGNYQAILEEGSDPRGIDVALIFRKDVMNYVSHKAFLSATTFKTRCILYVRLTDRRSNTYHLFVNHWKSREGGGVETGAKRAENAQLLKHLTDSIAGLDAKANIVIMGDFNDEPKDKSIAETLGALAPVASPVPTSLYNLLYEPYLKGEGTLFYKDWDVFDQIIVSGNLLIKKRGKGPYIEAPFATIFKQDWMLYTNKNGEKTPNRTASSKDYFGGYSDHLPVYTVIRY
jgi:hypothetical protein